MNGCEAMSPEGTKATDEKPKATAAERLELLAALDRIGSEESASAERVIAAYSFFEKAQQAHEEVVDRASKARTAVMATFPSAPGRYPSVHTGVYVRGLTAQEHDVWVTACRTAIERGTVMPATEFASQALKAYRKETS